MKATKKETAARIQRSVAGFQIPMLAIVKLYRALEEAIAEGKSDEDLKTIVALTPGVTKSLL